jgi:hypothetical protein
VNPDIPRDEIIGWLYGDEDADNQDDDDDDEELVDVTEVSNGKTNDVVDSGVTSGADPSGWDPIDIDRRP